MGEAERILRGAEIQSTNELLRHEVAWGIELREQNAIPFLLLSASTLQPFSSKDQLHSDAWAEPPSDTLYLKKAL